jgi:hypothetical protein
VPKVQFKFREETSSDDRDRLLTKLEESGAENVEPLFPDTPDEELSSFYGALIEEPQFEALLRSLRRSRKIEFAEPEPVRTLILPEELRERQRRSTRNGS